MAEETPRPKYLFGYDFMKRLQDAGLIGKAVQRVVIDCRHDDYARMYVQSAVDSRVLDAFLADPGVEVRVIELPRSPNRIWEPFLGWLRTHR